MNASAASEPKTKERSSNSGRAAGAGTRAVSTILQSVGRRSCRGTRGIAATTRPRAAEIIEPWPDPVETAALLEELIKQLQRFVVFKYDTDPAAAALWIAFAWIHDAVAIHSPILAVMAPDINCGKSTMLGALKYLTPRPYAGVD